MHGLGHKHWRIHQTVGTELSLARAALGSSPFVSMALSPVAWVRAEAGADRGRRPDQARHPSPAHTQEHPAPPAVAIDGQISHRIDVPRPHFGSHFLTGIGIRRQRPLF
jgi:hypothetical protein